MSDDTRTDTSQAQALVPLSHFSVSYSHWICTTNQATFFPELLIELEFGSMYSIDLGV